jgi:NADPH-dependent ferric siderophore reductase
MPVEAKKHYRSANRDRWLLVRDPGSGRVVVRHEPNAPSGGWASDTRAGDFLARGGGRGPAHRELPRPTGTPVEADAPPA